MPERGSKVSKVAGSNINEEYESVKLKEMEAEISRLKEELEDTKETVDILKQVIRDNSEREKQKG